MKSDPMDCVGHSKTAEIEGPDDDEDSEQDLEPRKLIAVVWNVIS